MSYSVCPNAMVEVSLRVNVALRPILTVGVGYDPDTLACVWGTNVLCRYNMPLRIIPDLGQSPTNSVDSFVEQVGHVLHDNVEGS